MILKHRSGMLALVMVVLACLFISSIKYDFSTIKYDIEKFYIQTLGVGFSSLKKIRSAVKRNPFDAVVNRITRSDELPVLDRIDIDVGILEWKQILADRDRGLANSMLSNPEYVKARVRYGGNSIKAKIRLKGDLEGHWDSPYRLSLRVSLKKKTVLGFKKFSLHKPAERQHPYEQVFQSLMRRMDNLSSLHNYIHVYVNGEDWGVMNIEEHMSKELLEKQKKKESIIVRFSNDNGWLYSRTTRVKKRQRLPNRLGDELLNVDMFGESKNLRKDVHRKWLSYITAERLKLNKDIYDVDAYSRALFLGILWGNGHTLADTNARHYFNPYSLRLEPITTDQGSFKSIEKDLFGGRYNPLKRNVIYRLVVPTDQYRKNLKQNLIAAKLSVKHINKELKKYQEIFPLDKKILGKTVLSNSKYFTVKKARQLPREVLSFRKNLAESVTANKRGKGKRKKSKLSPPGKGIDTEYIPQFLYARHYDSGLIDVYNLIRLPIKLTSITHKRKQVLTEDVIIPAYKGGEYRPFSIQTSYEGIQDGEFTVTSKLGDKIIARKIGPTLFTKELHNPLLTSPVKLPDFIRGKKGSWKISAGEWVVDNPLIIDGDLLISPGSRIKFKDDSYIIVKGSVKAVGKKNKPIIFEPLQESWKGIYVFEAQKQSILEHVIIKNTAALEDGILNLTGGVSFYRSDARFKNVTIDGTIAEDALNIIESDFKLEKVTIRNTVSDGLDSDYSTGTIVDSELLNIGGDGVDFSGSEITITNISARNVHDKAVSVGEGSKVNVNGGLISDVGVGIAVKDGSQASVGRIDIRNFELSTAMTYMKKDIYDSPVLVINNDQLDGNEVFSRQEGTSLSVNGKEVSVEEIDVKTLYKEGVMKK
jgi:hypothetical protein